MTSSGADGGDTLGDQGPEAVSSRAEQLRQRFEAAGNRADLDEAIRLGREAVRRATTGPADIHGLAAFRLGTTLSVLSEQTGLARDIDEALALLDTADRLLPDGHPDLPAVAANRAAALVQRFLRSGAPGELDEAIVAARRSIALSARDDPGTAVRHSNLGGLLRTRFQMTGTRSDIDAAIEQGRLAVGLLTEQMRQPAAFHAALAASLTIRFTLTHADEDLAEAIETARRSRALAPIGGRERLMALGVLAPALQTDFERTGNPERQSEAIDCLRETTDTLPHGHMDRPASLANLASALLGRYERFSAREDLDEAIVAARRALDEGQAADEAVIRRTLASALLRLGRQRTVDGDTAAAVEACDEALREAARSLDRLPPGHPGRSDCHVVAANAWISRFEAGGDAADAQNAIKAYRAAIDSLAQDDPRRGLIFHNLGVFHLLGTVDRPHTSQVLAEAIHALREAVRLCPPGHPIRARAVGALAVALLRTYLSALQTAGTGGAAVPGTVERDEALALFAQLDGSMSTPPGLRLLANQLTGVVRSAEGDVAGACATYAAAVELLPQTAWHGLGQAVKERELADRTGLGSDAAAVHVAAGAPGRALELLEQGRGVLWSQRLARRFVDVRLEEVLPDHAKRLRELTQALDAVG